MSDAVLNQILNQLQALQLSQQSLQAKVRRTVDARSIPGVANRVWLVSVAHRSTVLSPPVAFQVLRAPWVAF